MTLTPGRERKRCARTTCQKWFVAPKCHKRRFCSHTCAMSGRVRERSNRWKGGRSIHKQSGRVTILQDGKHVLEHRVVVQAPVSLVVHHKDEDPTNNHPDNLQLMSRSEHTRLHNFLNPRRDHTRDTVGRFTRKRSLCV